MSIQKNHVSLLSKQKSLKLRRNIKAKDCKPTCNTKTKDSKRTLQRQHKRNGITLHESQASSCTKSLSICGEKLIAKEMFL